MQDLTVPRNALVANVSASGALTNLVCAAFTAGPTLTVGQVYKFTGLFKYLHTAAATPTLTLELSVEGTAIVAAVATPVSTATTFSGKVEAYMTVRAVGASGSVMGAVQLEATGLTLANAEGGTTLVDTTPDTIDLTTTKLFELRARMTTAVASNTLTFSQGWVERVVG